jgi:peptidoglycan/xylan/chitin deacetylase (PgdA/CDA1 family)
MQSIGEGDRPILGWDALNQLPASVECGAHSHTHPQLDLVSLSAAREEIFLSRQLLETHLERPIHSFCYPFGYYSEAVSRIVQEAGFKSACAVLLSMYDIFTLPRLLVAPNITTDQFARLLTQQSTRVERQLRSIAALGWRQVRRIQTHLEG